MTNPYDQEADRQFEQIANNYHQEVHMPAQRKSMDAPSAIGTLLIILAILAVIPWGFGLDRFLWIAAGAGGVGFVMLVADAIAGRVKR